MAQKKFSQLPVATEFETGDKILVGRDDVGYSMDASLLVGITSFEDLDDVEGDFTGHSGEFLAISGDETSVEYRDIEISDIDGLEDSLSLRVPGRVVSLDFTLALDDLGQFIEAANPIEITIPDEATLDLGDGFIISGFNHASGELTFDATDVTLLVNGDLTAEVPQNGCFSLMKSRVAADTWILYGYLVLAP